MKPTRGFFLGLKTALVIFCSYTLIAQDTHYRFSHYGLEEGLSQSTVNDIIQDREGYVWMATAEGLNRFDGYEFKVFLNDPNDPNSLPHSAVHELFVDSEGTLWVGTFRGLARYVAEYETFEYVGLGGSTVPSVDSIVEGAGVLWLGTNEGIVGLRDEEVIWVQRGRSRENYVRSLQVGNDGRLYYVDTQDYFWAYDPETKRTVELDLTLGSAVSTFYWDTHGGLWIGSVGTLWHFEGGLEGTPRQILLDRFENSSIKSMVMDGEGSLWLGTDQGLAQIFLEDWDLRYIHKDEQNLAGLRSFNMNYLYVDRSASLWVGTHAGGVYRLPLANNRFGLIGGQANHERALENGNVHAIVEDEDGRLWVATDGGVDYWSEEEGRFKRLTFDHGPPEVMVLHEGADGYLYMGYSHKHSLVRLDRNTLEKVPLGPDARYITIYEDGKGTMWAGTRGGLFEMTLSQPETAKIHRVGAGLLSNMVFAIAPAEAEGLWLGTMNGLCRFVDGKTAYYLSSTGLQVIDIIPGDGFLWLGTSNGLIRWEPGDETPEVGVANGQLVNEVIYSLLQDSDGYLWVGHGKGLSRYDVNTDQLLNFDRSHGLQSNEFNHNAKALLENGRLAFGGIRGLNLFDPRRVVEPEPPVTARFTDFLLMNKRVQPGMEGSPLPMALGHLDELTLEHDDLLFAFEFAAPGASHPKTLRFQYQLIGFHDAWVDTNYQRRVVPFTGLGASTYTLKIRAACGEEGEWGPESELKIHMKPPPWRRLEAYFLYVALVLAVIFGGIQYQTRKLRREKARIATFNKELEEKVNERTALLEERSAELDAQNRKLHAHATELEILDHIVKAINQEMDFEGVFNSFMKEGRQLFPSVVGGGFLLYRPRSSRILFRVSEGASLVCFDDAKLAFDIFEEVGETHMISDYISNTVHPDDNGYHTIVMEALANEGYRALLLVHFKSDGLDILKVKTLERFREHLVTAVNKARALYELGTTQKELMEEAHLAGMAEIAADVIHNIGNALNSVRTSAQILRDDMNHSKALEMLNMLIKKLELQGDNLGDFITNDPMGKRVPEALQRIYSKLLQNDERQAEETRSLEDKLQKAIGLLSESQAHASKQQELLSPLSLNELINEALVSKSFILKQRGITVRRLQEALPLVQLDRGKIQRIMLYLLKNAWEALEETSEGNRFIDISTDLEDGEAVLKVSDFGMGADEMVLENAFKQGFTTKQDQRGFGLHYCANAVREMHGTISIHSGGKGRGCRVEIRFPANNNGQSAVGSEQ